METATSSSLLWTLEIMADSSDDTVRWCEMLQGTTRRWAMRLEMERLAQQWATSRTCLVEMLKGAEMVCVDSAGPKAPAQIWHHHDCSPKKAAAEPSNSNEPLKEEPSDAGAAKDDYEFKYNFSCESLDCWLEDDLDMDEYDPIF